MHRIKHHHRTRFRLNDTAVRGSARGLRLMTCLLVSVFLALPGAVHGKGSKVTDATIRQAVTARLQNDAAVSRKSFDVAVDRGVVTLTGSVASLFEKDRAVQLAESLRGVASVVDLLSCRPPVRPDSEIRRDIENALADAAAIDADRIRVSVKDGTAVLDGQVDSWARSRTAGQTVKRVRGVTAVNNRIRVVYASNRPDPAIARDIEAILASDVRVRSNMIDVDVRDGNVFLSGTVGSATEKSRAHIDAFVAGVKAVNAEGIEVRWETGRSRGGGGIGPVVRADSDIREAIQRAIRYDPRVNSVLPDIVVKDGRVTMEGVVDTLRAKRAAEEDAWNASGVWQVINRLHVRYAKWPDDEGVASRIKGALGRDTLIWDDDIHVKVEEHEVTLSGSVDSDSKKIRAELIASQIPGVLALSNRIEVERPKKRRADTDLKMDVHNELFWSPFVDADSVQVSVQGKRVTLKGEVDSLFEGDAAIQNAFEAGAASVRAELKLPGGRTDSRYFPNRDNFFGRNSRRGSGFIVGF